MLTEERHEKIMRLVNTSGAVSVQDLVSFLNISESTVRRDLLTLDREGRLRRVHGGATTLRDDSLYEADMENLQDKYSIHMSEKRRIAQYAARLIHKEDFVYLDAGSTTEQLVEFLAGSEATFVTNSIPLAQKLGRIGGRVYIVPGRVKGDTEAIVGSEMRDMIGRYHFTKGFLVPTALQSIPAARRPMMKRPFVKEPLWGSAWTALSWPIPVSSAYLHILHLQNCQWLR